MEKLSFTSSSNVVRILIKMLLALGMFLVLNVLVYVPLNYMYFKSFGGNSGAQINNVLRMGSDVFIFGASRASHHYDTEIISKSIGMSVFNAGDDGKNAVYQLGLLKMLLKHHKPKVIVYEVGDLSQSLDGGTVDLFPYYYYDRSVRKLLQRRDSWAFIKFIFPIYAYNAKAFSIIKGYLNNTQPFLSGFRPIEGTMLSQEIKIKSEDKSKVVPESTVDSFALMSFINFVELCDTKGVSLVFVYSPAYLPTNPAGEAQIERIAKLHRIEYYDFGQSNKYNFESKLFKDAGHLNREGAKMFTIDLVNSIINSDASDNVKH